MVTLAPTIVPSRQSLPRIECLLVTSSAVAHAPYTLLRDRAERIAATVNALDRWRAADPGLRIVLCDGSDHDFLPLLRDRHPTSHLEVLHFRNDQATVAMRGKGFGEGQIVQFALTNSRFLAGADAFAKCTGKLWVANWPRLARDWHPPFVSNLRLRSPKHWNSNGLFEYADTRFYLSTRTFYEQHLARAHEQVDDAAGHSLEHAFLHALLRSEIPLQHVLPQVAPIVKGLSGTTGLPFDEHGLRLLDRLKHLVKRSLVRAKGSTA